jgi:hypothetical protein
MGEGLMHEGDEFRLRALHEIVSKCGIRAFVETGAWKGDTVIWAYEAFPGLDAYMTCEAYAPHFDVAWERTRLLDRVCCSPVSSPRFLMDLPADLVQPTLFYLDAHWQDYWPLRAELQVVTSRWPRSIIIVDDAFVPGRPCFIGCRGGGGEVGVKWLGNRTRPASEGELLDVNLIRSELPAGWHIAFPDYEAAAPGYAICSRESLLSILGKTFKEA